MRSKKKKRGDKDPEGKKIHESVKEEGPLSVSDYYTEFQIPWKPSTRRVKKTSLLIIPKKMWEEEAIEKELADVTFEELQKARSNGAHAFFQKPKEDIKLKRANKNRPMEASTKKPVTGFREVIQAPKKVVRDPRFESLCGKLDPDGFRKRYNFLYENDLPAERQALKKELKKYKDPKRVNEIEERISWIDKQVKSDSAKHIDAEILAKHKKKEREAAKQGKRPFYLKKSEIRKQRLIEKYNHLKSSGKLEAFVEKRRRRNAAKDHRYMPYRRSGDVE